MTDTLWLGRFYFFVPVAALTATLKNNIADSLANNGSFQVRADELAMFLHPHVQASATGNLPATAVGWNLAVKPAMRDAIRALINAVANNKYYVVANTDVPAQGWMEGQLLATDSAVLQVGSIQTWDTCLADALAATGLKLIP